MPRDDRDQNFEKALAGSLRSSNAAPANDCLDAETLAAYHERLLDPEEMAQRKAHIASCERCQEILAQLEATDSIVVEADRDLLLDQIVLDIPETEPTPAAAAEDSAPMAEAPSLAASESAPEAEVEHDPELVPASSAAPSIDLSRAAAPISVAAAAAKSPASSATITFRAPREDRPKMVRFVALFGAIAAAVIFWLVYRDQSNKNFELAQNHQQAKLEMPPQSPASAPPSAAENKDAAPSSQISEPKPATPQTQNPSAPVAAQPAPSKPVSPQVTTDADAVTNALKDAKKTIDSAKALEKQSRGDTIGGRSAREERDKSAAAGALVAPGAALRMTQDTSARKLDAANQPQIDSAIAAANLPSGIPATPPPARTKMNPGVVTESVTVGSANPPVAQVSASASDTLSKTVNGRFVASPVPLSVPAPSGTTIWRIGQAGMIQRSTDSGTTWFIQPSGVVSDLIAGSAYSDQICWLVGRNGVVLRTTNGGATWQKLTSPSNIDLLGVFSINADSATVTDAAGRAFETTSGGAHWTRTALQP
jgi:hypothetical protein